MKWYAKIVMGAALGVLSFSPALWKMGDANTEDMKGVLFAIFFVFSISLVFFVVRKRRLPFVSSFFLTFVGYFIGYALIGLFVGART